LADFWSDFWSDFWAGFLAGFLANQSTDECDDLGSEGYDVCLLTPFPPED